jgi:HK97 family phage prohead protease
MEQLSALLQETVTQAAEGGEQRVFRYLAHGVEENRLGYILTADGWQLDGYRRNPVFLASHDSHAFPIGRVKSVSQEDRGLVIDVVFDQEDPLAQTVQRKYEQGFLNAVSVGFTPQEIVWPQDAKDVPRITKKELLEVSAVSIPGDATALRLGNGDPTSALMAMLRPAVVQHDVEALRQARDYIDRLLEAKPAGDPQPDPVTQQADPPLELDIDLAALAAFAQGKE